MGETGIIILNIVLWLGIIILGLVLKVHDTDLPKHDLDDENFFNDSFD